MALFRRAQALCLSALLVFQSACNTGSSSGGLDTSFGGSGIVTIAFNAGAVNDEARAIAIQTDGKILVGGKTASDFALVRLNANGSLDATFGIGGKVQTDFAGGTDELRGLALQPDGKILAVGSTLSAGGSLRFALARYESNGTLDTTFNGGAFSLAVGSGNDEARAVVVQGDGSILVAGSSSVTAVAGSQRRFAVIRLFSNGTLDAAFGSGGKAILTLGSDDDATALALRTDGKILVSGSTRRQAALGSASLHYEFGIVRLTTLGALDVTFGAFSGGNGISTANFGQNPNLSPADKGISNDTALGMGVTNDGRIYVVGVTNDAKSDQLGIIRFRENGDVDSTFATQGFYRATNLSGSSSGRGITISTDGSATAAGVFLGGTNTTLTTRVDSSGRPITGFGDQGNMLTSVGSESEAFAIAPQSDGKVVIAGRTLASGTYDFFVARLGL